MGVFWGGFSLINILRMFIFNNTLIINKLQKKHNKKGKATKSRIFEELSKMFDCCRNTNSAFPRRND